MSLKAGGLGLKLKRRKLALYRAVLAWEAAGRRGAAISREDFGFLLE